MTAPRTPNVIVVAGAGAGKTRALVGEYVASLFGADLDGKVRSPHRVVAITFTDKAAAEMKSRVAGQLSEIARSRLIPEELSARLDEHGLPPLTPSDAEWLSRHLPGAPISTFHALCVSLLKGELALSAGIDPGFQLLDDADERLLLAETAEGVVLDRLSSGDKVVAELSARFQLRAPGSGFGFVSQLAGVYKSLSEQGKSAAELTPARTQKAAEARRKDAAQRLREALSDLLAATEHSGDRFAIERMATLRTRAEMLFDALQHTGPDDEGRIVSAVERLRKEDRPFGRGAVHDARLRFFGDLNELCAALIDVASAPQAEVVCSMLQQLEERVRRELDARGVLGFGDLLVRTRDLLRDDLAARARIKSRFDRVLVDEYQDTSPVQEDLVALLAETPDQAAPLQKGEQAMGSLRLAPGRLFVVGDPKQSIYGFRGADARIFAHTRDVLVEGTEAMPATGTRRNLAVNYRSEPAVLELVNLVSAHSLAEGPFGVPFNAEDRLVPHKRGGSVGGAMLKPLARDMDDADRAEAVMVARKIRDLLDETNPLGTGEKLRPRDMAVLVRRIAPATDIAFALAHVGVPAHITGGAGFYTRPEITDAICALRLLTEPEDELATLALLRSAFVACPDDDLVALTGLTPARRFCWAELCKDPTKLTGAVGDRLLHLDSIFKELRNRLADTPLRQIFDRLLDETGYLLTVGVTSDAVDRFANLEKLRGILSGDATPTIEKLYNTLDRPPKEGPASVFEPDADAVRIMTIHQAKGLEFPVVFVADLGARPPPSFSNLAYDPDLGVAVSARGRTISALDSRRHPVPTTMRTLSERAAQKEQAELARVLYVALTRAERRLYLVGEERDTEAMSLRRIIEQTKSRDPHAFERLLPSERVDVVPGPRRPLAARALSSENVPTTQAPKGPLRVLPSDFGGRAHRGSRPIDIYAKRKGRVLHRLVARAFEHGAPLDDSTSLDAVLSAVARAEGQDSHTPHGKEQVERARLTLEGPVKALVDDGYDLAFETPLSFSLSTFDRPVVVSGVADLIARKGERSIILELKSSVTAARSESTWQQLSAYACALATEGVADLRMGALVFGHDDGLGGVRDFTEDDARSLREVLQDLVEREDELGWGLPDDDLDDSL